MTNQQRCAFEAGLPEILDRARRTADALVVAAECGAPCAEQAAALSVALRGDAGVALHGIVTAGDYMPEEARLATQLLGWLEPTAAFGA